MEYSTEDKTRLRDNRAGNLSGADSREALACTALGCVGTTFRDVE